jgi:hypothetical protein
MPYYPSALVLSAGVFNLALALFHICFWQLFRWPASLGSLGYVNRQILYILNMAIAALFVLLGILLLVHTTQVATTGLGSTLLWGMSLFWLARALLQPVMFGLKKPLSVLLFGVFLLGAALHGFAAYSRSGI